LAEPSLGDSSTTLGMTRGGGTLEMTRGKIKKGSFHNEPFS